MEENLPGLQLLDPKDEAIMVWEKGALKEKQGSMTDAIKFYRQALKIQDNVEQLYRKKIQEEWKLQKRLERLKIVADEPSIQPEKNAHVEDHEGKESEQEDLPPCWLFEMLPNDLLLRIVKHTVLMSGSAWLNLSLTCSKFNELCFHNSIPYKTFASFIYSKQNFDVPPLELDFDKKWGSDYQRMLKERPYIHFEGIYISTVNYLRHGANAEGSSSLINPIHMITYYRYFRFYPDGYCLRLLTTEEPSQVVKTFSRSTLPLDSELCKWILSSRNDGGRLTISRSSEKYSFVEALQIRNRVGSRHQRLKWVFSTVIDGNDDASECSLRNEKPFFFSRVKSYAEENRLAALKYCNLA